MQGYCMDMFAKWFGRLNQFSNKKLSFDYKILVWNIIYRWSKYVKEIIKSLNAYWYWHKSPLRLTGFLLFGISYLHWVFMYVFLTSFAILFKVTEEDWLSETAVWPTLFLLNVFPLLLKELIIIFLFVVTAAGVVPCGIRKKRPRTSSIVQFLFYFWSFEISGRYSEKSENTIGLN